MEDDKIHSMWWRAVSTVLVLVMMGSNGHAAICPSACRCENDILKTSCASASLEFVPIQLNPELHELDISNNKIVQIHFSFPFYENLLNLNLSHNRIKTLGNSNFNSQKNLTRLDLSHNQIENLTRDSLKGLKALTYLDLSSNSLEEINPAAFRELHSLSVLKFGGNKLIHLEEGLFRACKNLKELYLNDNQFLELPTAALTDTVHLRLLSLSQNLILTVEDGDMPNLSELQTLLLDSNVISEIHPDGLSSLTALSHLDLSDNNITAMPTASLAKLSSLTTLRLSGNYISHILPVAFRGLFHLRVLKIDRLDTLKQIDSRAFVDNIKLEKNTHGLQCWLWQLIQEHKARSLKLNETYSEKKMKTVTLDLILDVNDIFCYGPEDIEGELLADATKSQMDCSVSWMAAVSVTVTVTFILAVIGGVLYWAPKRRSRPIKKEISEIQDTIRRNMPPPTPPRKNEPYEVQVEKYILPPHMMIQNDYRSLPSWDPYGAGTVNIYEQLNEPRDRPHIVYV
ncbi:hypothetical protein NQ318_021114 [Aromia moschata]|uniref:Uncharacterized protein n=1 Tax=Aromia moschata TaxID=1265417 RepID=A0AAV8YHA6_9CUCU|nr:hypothetical protein NQ318_021114 [Aromia moschata]